MVMDKKTRLGLYLVLAYGDVEFNDEQMMLKTWS